MLQCILLSESDGQNVKAAENAWSLVWSPETLLFHIQNPRGQQAMPNLANLSRIVTIPDRESFLKLALDFARQANCKPMLGQDNSSGVRVFLSYPWPKNNDIGNWGQAMGKPAPI